MDFKPYIRTIPDYPKKGIQFRDVTTLFADAQGFKAMRDKILRMAVRTDVDVDYTPGLGLFVEVESETGLDTGRTYALYVD